MDTISTKDTAENITSHFYTSLDTYSNKLRSVENQNELQTCINDNFRSLVEVYISVGDQVEENSKDPLEVYSLNYNLPADFKTLALLHRDVFLELNKGKIFESEKQANSEVIESHFQKSKTVLIEKLKDFNEQLDTENKTVITDDRHIKNITKKVSLQKNPWGIYKVQFETILDQISMIDQQQSLALNSVAIYEKLKAVLIDVTKNHTKLVSRITKSEDHILNSFNDSNIKDKLLPFIDEELNKQSGVTTNHAAFSESVNSYINTLDTLNLPISSNSGILNLREVDLKKRTQKWFDYQVLPEFTDMVSIETSALNKYNINLLNLKNNLHHSDGLSNDNDIDIIRKTLTNFKDEMKDLKEKSDSIVGSLVDKVKTELLLTNLIKGKPFLEVRLNSSLQTDSSSLINKIKISFRQKASSINSKYKESLENDVLNTIQISTECIGHRMYQDKSTHYDSLFLNKKFIGDLFLVKRTLHDEKLDAIYNQWQKGFSKAVLVCGDRLTGRSTFLEYTAKRLFGKDVVVLSPNSDAIIDGRKFKTSNDLKEALNYVKNNNAQSTKPVVIIDDLELWRDTEHSLLTNVRALIEFIETEADNTFVMVSTTSLMLQHLNQTLEISSSFSNSLDLNQAEENEIVNAILLRHGAAHREVFSEDLKMINEQTLQKLARKVGKQNSFNLGNSLQSWTYNTFVQEDESVVFKDSYYEFLDFFTPQEIIVLKQALLFKYISEFGIKRVTASFFESDYKSALRRLLNTKVLIRNHNGLLEINPVVVNDVSRIINQKINA